jgi:hypothetical protein
LFRRCKKNSLKSSENQWHYQRSIGCWHAMVGANWRPTPSILKVMCKRAKTGKKLPSTLAETLALWNNARPLRLMFQEEARFGRISDTRYCWCRRPFRSIVKSMVTQQYTYAYGAVSPMDGMGASIVSCFLMSILSGCKFFWMRWRSAIQTTIL